MKKVDRMSVWQCVAAGLGATLTQPTRRRRRSRLREIELLVDTDIVLSLLSEAKQLGLSDERNGNGYLLPLSTPDPNNPQSPGYNSSSQSHSSSNSSQAPNAEHVNNRYTQTVTQTDVGGRVANTSNTGSNNAGGADAQSPDNTMSGTGGLCQLNDSCTGP